METSTSLSSLLFRFLLLACLGGSHSASSAATVTRAIHVPACASRARSSRGASSFTCARTAQPQPAHLQRKHHHHHHNDSNTNHNSHHHRHLSRDQRAAAATITQTAPAPRSPCARCAASPLCSRTSAPALQQRERSRARSGGGTLSFYLCLRQQAHRAFFFPLPPGQALVGLTLRSLYIPLPASGIYRADGSV